MGLQPQAHAMETTRQGEVHLLHCRTPALGLLHPAQSSERLPTVQPQSVLSFRKIQFRSHVILNFHSKTPKASSCSSLYELSIQSHPGNLSLSMDHDITTQSDHSWVEGEHNGERVVLRIQLDFRQDKWHLG